MGKHRYLPEAFSFLHLARQGHVVSRLAKVAPTRSRRAAIASVLALYPSTTTEIPYT